MWVFVVILLVQFAISTTLSILNLRHLEKVAADPPEEWAGRLDTEQFPQLIAYSRAKSRLGHVSGLFDLGVTLAILVSGFLAALARWAASIGDGQPGPWLLALQGLAVWAVLGLIAYVAGLPWNLISTFGIERRFGFSTTTVATWLADQAKSLAIGAVLGTLLGGGFLLLIGWLGQAWWLPAWVLFSLFQLLMTFIAPVVLLPLFNRFEPLEDRELAEQINDLAERAEFPLQGVYQVDASRRSTHSNAYFTGLGRTRRIALFDTLLEQHPHDEILAVLAHEIGHWKKGHIVTSMLASFVVAGVGLALVALLLDAPWLYEVFELADLHAQIGAVGPVAAVGTYLVSVLLSPLSLILAPIATWFSRRHERQADAYSLRLYPQLAALEGALIRLSEKNLANLFPHPLVVIYRYSHPPLLDRVAAIRKEWEEQVQKNG